MPILDLLRQVAVEHENLQSDFNALLVEHEALQSQLARVPTRSFPISHAHKKQFAIDPLHTAPPPEDEAYDCPDSPGHRSTKASVVSVLTKVRQSAWETANNASFLSFAPKSSNDPTTTRQKILGCLSRPYVEVFFAATVISNIGVLWIDADIRARKDPRPAWLAISEVTYLAIYSFEFSLRCVGLGAQVFKDSWNIFDFVIIFIDLIFLVADLVDGVKLQMFRILRFFRVTRVVMVFRFAAELQLLIHGFFGAARALIFATIMLWIVMTIWAFLFVETVYPLVQEMIAAGDFSNCPRCQVAYSSVFQAQLTMMQQIIAGDSWGLVTIEVIEKYPASAFVFFGSLLTIQLGLLNLILTVIVDAADRKRQEDEQIVLDQKDQKFQVMKEKALKLCRCLDIDETGDLTLDEIRKGYNENGDFAAALHSLDINIDDLGAMFMIMDEDRSGSVSYEEFVNSLYKLKSQDMETTLFFIKGYVSDVCHKVRHDIIFLQRQHLEELLEIKRVMGNMMSQLVEYVSDPMSDRKNYRPQDSPDSMINVQQQIKELKEVVQVALENSANASTIGIVKVPTSEETRAGVDVIRRSTNNNLEAKPRIMDALLAHAHARKTAAEPSTQQESTGVVSDSNENSMGVVSDSNGGRSDSSPPLDHGACLQAACVSSSAVDKVESRSCEELFSEPELFKRSTKDAAGMGQGVPSDSLSSVDIDRQRFPRAV